MCLAHPVISSQRRKPPEAAWNGLEVHALHYREGWGQHTPTLESEAVIIPTGHYATGAYPPRESRVVAACRFSPGHSCGCLLSWKGWSFQRTYPTCGWLSTSWSPCGEIITGNVEPLPACPCFRISVHVPLREAEGRRKVMRCSAGYPPSYINWQWDEKRNLLANRLSSL